ncbi:MAG: hypothetical protein QOG91_496 [Candidatus Parcubacteria bacterium]|jgi:hypothetical protein|nr:hypothetical protein [Candidatus Parcubacteria bacterium]
MNKSHCIFVVASALLLACVFGISSSARAEDARLGNGHEKTIASSSKAGTISGKFRQNYENRILNLKNNQEIRNLKIEEMRKPLHARKEVFERQKNRLIGELNRALTNLHQIRGRINSRIEKAEQSGRDMSEAKKFLIIADDKLAVAQTAISSLILLVPQSAQTASTTDAANSSTTAAALPAGDSVDLTGPRLAGALAIKAIHEARRALNDVVVAIAHATGLKIGQISASTTSATTTP